MSQLIPLQLEDVNFDKINIKKPLSYPNCELIVNDLYYNNNSFLLIMGALQICHKSKTNIKLIDTKQSMENLQNKLVDIINRVRNNKNYIKLFQKKEYHSMFEKPNVVNFKNICCNDTRAFDLENTPIDLDNLRRGDNVCAVLYLKNIWINERYYGVNMKLCQIQRLEPLGLRKQLVNSFFSAQPVPIPPPPPPPPNTKFKSLIKISHQKNVSCVQHSQIF
uniref:Uncharacterized protein n=1 Tax=Pyramimonas orientalis virus TaxID=455367 RepID=A0A7L9AYR3_POV01|nr:hypothetical protein HWQ62_00253 [Pyramimonas orientalis virus]